MEEKIFSTYKEAFSYSRSQQLLEEMPLKVVTSNGCFKVVAKSIEERKYSGQSDSFSNLYNRRKAYCKSQKFFIKGLQEKLRKEAVENLERQRKEEKFQRLMEKLKKEQDNKIFLASTEESNKRNGYMTKKHEEYTSLPTEKLDRIWQESESLGLSDDEISVLRNVIRKRRNIVPEPGGYALKKRNLW